MWDTTQSLTVSDWLRDYHAVIVYIPPFSNQLFPNPLNVDITDMKEITTDTTGYIVNRADDTRRVAQIIRHMDANVNHMMSEKTTSKAENISKRQRRAISRERASYIFMAKNAKHMTEYDTHDGEHNANDLTEHSNGMTKSIINKADNVEHVTEYGTRQRPANTLQIMVININALHERQHHEHDIL